MDFKSLVDFIIEAGPATADPGSAPGVDPTKENKVDPNAELEKQTIEDFIQTYANDIKTAYEKKYGVVPGNYLSETNLQQLAYIAMEKCKRTTAESNFYKPFDYVFPLLDLFGFLTRLFIKGSTATEDQKKAEVDKFIKYLKETPSNIPLDYKPLNSWANMVKNHYFSNAKTEESLGSLRLDDIVKKFPTLSFYWLVLELAAFYMKGKTAKFPTKYNSVIQLGNTKVTEILTKIVEFKGGTTRFNEPALTEAYGSAFFDRILRVSVNLYELYRQQAAQALGKNSGLEENSAVYQQFIGVQQKSGAVPLIWGKFAKTTTTESISSNYKLGFESLWENLIDQINSSNLILESGWFRLGDGKIVKIDDGGDEDTNSSFVIKYTVVDKKDHNKPDPNYDPVVLNVKDFEAIYDKNVQVQKEVSNLIQQQNKKNQYQTNLLIKNPKDKKVLFTYFSKASGPNSTEEKTIDSAVQGVLQQRLKDQLIKRRQNKSAKTNVSTPENTPSSVFYLKNELGEDIKTTEFLYNSTKLKEATDGGDPLSATLWKSLEAFASFIQTSEKNDWASDVKAGLAAGAAAAQSGQLRAV